MLKKGNLLEINGRLRPGNDSILQHGGFHQITNEPGCEGDEGTFMEKPAETVRHIHQTPSKRAV